MSGPNQGWNPDGTPRTDADQQPTDYGQPQPYKSPLEGYPGYTPPPDQSQMPPPYPGAGPEQQPYGTPPQPYGAPQQPYGAPEQPYYPGQPVYYPPPPPPPPKSFLRRNLGAIIILLIVVGAVGGYLVFGDRLSAPASDLAVGHCIDEPTATTEITDVQRQPCNEPHDGEVFAVINHTAAPGAVYPPSTEFRDMASDECLPALESYTGKTYIALYAEGVDVSFLYPTSSSWSEGDREMTCFLVKTDDSKMTGSLRAGAAPASP